MGQSGRKSQLWAKEMQHDEAERIMQQKFQRCRFFFQIFRKNHAAEVLEMQILLSDFSLSSFVSSVNYLHYFQFHIFQIPSLLICTDLLYVPEIMLSALSYFISYPHCKIKLGNIIYEDFERYKISQYQYWIYTVIVVLLELFIPLTPYNSQGNNAINSSDII